MNLPNLLPCRTTWRGRSSRCCRSRTTSGRPLCDPTSFRRVSQAIQMYPSPSPTCASPNKITSATNAQSAAIWPKGLM